MRMALRLRFDYGHIVPWVRRDGEYLAAVAGPDAVWLHTRAPIHGEDLATIAEFEVSAGQRVPFVLTHAPSHLPRPEPAQPERLWLLLNGSGTTGSDDAATKAAGRPRFEGRWCYSRR